MLVAGMACYVADVIGRRLRAARCALLAVHVKHAATRATAPAHSRQGQLHHHEQCADHVSGMLVIVAVVGRGLSGARHTLLAVRVKHAAT